MDLSTEQIRALDLGLPTCLTAGAGSGKTRVLIERYLLALEAADFDLDAVLAVTFTKKATAEILRRVRDAISARIAAGDGNAARWKRLRDRIPDAWVMTIDAFCHRVLSTMGPASGLPAQRRILVGGALAEIMNESVRQVIDRVAADPEDADREALRRLLLAVGRNDLVAHLRMLIERRARAVPWAEAVLAGRAIEPPLAVAILARLTGETSAKVGANDADHQALLAALARIFHRLLATYRKLLGAAQACDFRQLLEDVAAAFQDERIRRVWAGRFRHVLVDEFQDTDPLQWEVLRKLFGRDRIGRPGLFVVGDEKQAIFSFRDGDVVTFREASAEIGNAGGAVETLADNYRSTQKLVTFCNEVSKSLFGSGRFDFEARHAAMNAARSRQPGTEVASHVEIMIARGAGPGQARERELHGLASRIRRFVDERTEVLGALPGGGHGIRPARLSDQAVLLRTRRILPDLEAVLHEHGIPFRVLGGVGFFQCHEVRMLMNLMRCLADEGDDLALMGVLRSPLFMIADSVLARAVAEGREGRGSLWRKVRRLAASVRSGAAATPTPTDGPVLVEAVERLDRYRRLADRLPVNELLALAVRESDLLLTLGVVDPSGRSAGNVEKLLDMVRNLQAQGLAGLDEMERTLSRTDHESDAPEAQADPPATGRDAVSIQTVHAAKGLEWPIVLLPNAGADALKTRNEDLPPLRLVLEGETHYLHAIKAHDVAGGKTRNRVQTGVAEVARRELEAEARRLLYVAVTRARDHLVILGSVLKDAPPESSWLGWVMAAGDAGARVLDPVPVLDPPRTWVHPVFSEPVLEDDERAPKAAPPGDRAPRGGKASARRRGRVDSLTADLPFVFEGDPAPELPLPAPPQKQPSAQAVVIPATAIATLESCARRFFLEHVVGVGVVPGNGASPGIGAGDLLARTRGSIVHGALEGIATGADPVSRVAGIAAEAGVRSPESVTELEKQVRGALDAFRRWPIGREILQAPPGRVRTEVPFDLVRKEGRIVGTIDLLYEPESGSAVVVDFKTDREAPGSPDAAREHARNAGYLAQVAGYAAAVEIARGRPVSAYLFFTQSGVAVPLADDPLSSEDCAARIDRVVEKARIAAAAGFPLTTSAAICRDCPHQKAGTCAGAGVI